jgi:hippurate hydrolase
MRKRLKSEEIFSRMVKLRRTIHRYPELAFEEEKTAGLIMNELKRLGIPYKYGGVGGGVIARIGSDNGVPTVALRAEMACLRT